MIVQQGIILENVWTAWSATTQTVTVDSISGINQAQLQQVWTIWAGQVATAQNLATINQQISQINYTNLWSNWCQQLTITNTVGTAIPASAQPEAWRAQQAQAQRIEQDRKRAEQEAKDKAEVLLLKHLSDQQKEDLKKNGYFLVEVAGETYKIIRGFAGNIKLLDKDKKHETKSFCIHPRERIPDADAMLAQKLLLEADTERFHKIANVTNLVPQNDNRRAA